MRHNISSVTESPLFRQSGSEGQGGGSRFRFPPPERRFCTMDVNPCNPTSCSYNPTECYPLPVRNESLKPLPKPWMRKQEAPTQTGGRKFEYKHFLGKYVNTTDRTKKVQERALPAKIAIWGRPANTEDGKGSSGTGLFTYPHIWDLDKVKTVLLFRIHKDGGTWGDSVTRFLESIDTPKDVAGRQNKETRNQLALWVHNQLTRGPAAGPIIVQNPDEAADDHVAIGIGDQGGSGFNPQRSDEILRQMQDVFKQFEDEYLKPLMQHSTQREIKQFARDERDKLYEFIYRTPSVRKDLYRDAENAEGMLRLLKEYISKLKTEHHFDDYLQWVKRAI